VTVDRRIELGVAVPDFGSALHTGTGGSQQRQEPEAGARERFEQALTSGTLPAGPAGAAAASPFSLLAQRTAPATAAPDPHLSQGIGSAVERLMVSDGRSGNQQVRMELKDDLLPGVTVIVQELEGRLQVDFICSVEASRLRLNEAAPSQAHELAQRLRRDVLLRVQTDDEDDPCLLEAAASC
jgi:hypothetical protein